jgi:hypothetical protein
LTVSSQSNAASGIKGLKLCTFMSSAAAANDRSSAHIAVTDLLTSRVMLCFALLCPHNYTSRPQPEVIVTLCDLNLCLN